MVRDGLVIDYGGAVDLLTAMKKRVECSLGRELTHAASGFPTEVSQAEVRATANVAEVSGMRCETLIDEPTGGTHFSLVISGSLGIRFEEVEELKKPPSQQTRFFPFIRPVMEKGGSTVERHLRGVKVNSITLVGGSCAFPSMAQVLQEVISIPSYVPERPFLITQLGIALHDTQDI